MKSKTRYWWSGFFSGVGITIIVITVTFHSAQAATFPNTEDGWKGFIEEVKKLRGEE